MVKKGFWILAMLLLLSNIIIACQSARINCKSGSDLAGSANGGIITIAWDSNTEPHLAGYEVHYGTSSGKTPREYPKCVDVGKATESAPGVTQYNLTGLVKGKRYYIAVIAYSNQLRSKFSNEVNGVAK